MTIILQDRATGCYLDESGGWTGYVQHAHDFRTSAEALDARCQHQLIEAALVFRFEREGYAITVPLDGLESKAVA